MEKDGKQPLTAEWQQSKEFVICIESVCLVNNNLKECLCDSGIIIKNKKNVFYKTNPEQKRISRNLYIAE